MKTFITNCLCLFAFINTTNIIADELVTSEVVGKNIFGLANDVNGDPLMIDEMPLVFETAAFEKKISSVDAKSFFVSGFGDVIGGLYLSLFDDESKRFIDTNAFDLSAIGGLSRPRGGVTTAWDSVLFSEAGLVDGADSISFIEVFKSYYKGKADIVKPYNYGWLAEAILLDNKGSAKIIKNYSVGRLFASQLYLMPDGRSLYLFDAENTGQLYFYVAAVAESLTNGTLYGVNFFNGKADYVLLGSSSALKMKFKLKKISFKKLFDTSPLKEAGCASGFNHIDTIYGEECLKQKKKNRKYVGLFEPIRMLAMKGNNHPRVKLTDVKYDQDNNRLVLDTEGGSTMKLSLGHNIKLNSRYVIEEVQR